MRHDRTRSILISLLICLCSFHSIAQAEPPPETAHLQGEAKEIADWLINAQRSGWESHDAKTYAEQWADDAVLIWGRSAKPGKYDQALKGASMIKCRTILMRSEPDGFRMRFKDARVTIDGDKAVVQWVAHTITGDRFYQKLLAESYQLTKQEDGWSVVENRVWPLGEAEGRTRRQYTEARWQALDKAVDEAEALGDPRNHAFALMDAYRFKEAYQIAVDLSELDNASADDWVLRGVYASIAGMGDDIDASFEKARSIDPEVRLPPYAKPQGDKDQADDAIDP